MRNILIIRHGLRALLFSLALPALLAGCTDASPDFDLGDSNFMPKPLFSDTKANSSIVAIHSSTAPLALSGSCHQQARDLEWSIDGSNYEPILLKSDPSSDADCSDGSFNILLADVSTVMSLTLGQSKMIDVRSVYAIGTSLPSQIEIKFTTTTKNTHLVFSGVSTNYVAGSAPTVQVNIIDSDTGVDVIVGDPDYTANLTMEVYDSADTLLSSSTVTASAGIANFTASSITLKGSGYYFTVSKPDTTASNFGSVANSQNSTPFAIDPAVGTQLVWSTQPANIVAGKALTPIVEVRDAYNNITNDSTANMVLSIASSSAATASLLGTKSIAIAAGVAKWLATDSFSADVVGDYILKATFSNGADTLIKNSNQFSVSHGLAHHLTWATQPASSIVAGSPIAPKIEIRDRYENVVTSDGTSVISVSVFSATSTPTPDPILSGTKALSVLSGVAWWEAGENMNLNMAATYILKASDGTLTKNSSVFDITDYCAGNTATLYDDSAMGTGTVYDPHLICTKAQLLSLQANCNSGVAAACALNFKMMAHIDLPTPATNNMSPIGSVSNQFSGSFNGNNFEIRNLAMTTASSNMGLFAFAAPSASIKNLKLDSPSIIGDASVGGFVGYFAGSIHNCHVINGGTIKGYNSVGGIAGNAKIDSRIEDSSNTADVAIDPAAVGASPSYFGGIVGSMSRGVVLRSHNSGNVLAPTAQAVGGLAGQATGGTQVLSSTSRGDVDGKQSVGGLVGYLNGGATYRGLINKSTASSNVIGTHYVGGLVGYVWSSDISQSISVGTVTSRISLGTTGGLIGTTDGSAAINIEDSYSRSTVTYVSTATGSHTTSGSGSFIGWVKNPNTSTSRCYATGLAAGPGTGYKGFVGADQSFGDSVYNYNYYDLDTTGGNTSTREAESGIEAQSTTQMKSGIAFNTWDNANIWIFDPGMYPTLRNVSEPQLP